MLTKNEEDINTDFMFVSLYRFICTEAGEGAGEARFDIGTNIVIGTQNRKQLFPPVPMPGLKPNW